jgi:type IV secretory pathway TraG/TraD family ATPase VirD4
MQFRVVNFTDPSSSARINPIAPSYIQNRAYLEEYVRVLLHNLNPSTHKNQDFWIRSTQVLLKSIVVFLHNNFPSYCSLPHAISFALLPLEQVLACIRLDPEASAYASSIFDAVAGGQEAGGQLAGITATFKVSLQLLLDKHVFWALSGEDLSLVMNDKNHPTLLCIGNYPPAKAAYSPIIALIITVCFKAMYGHNRVKSFVAIDELPTLYIPDLSELPATARKYGISTIACVQSNAQLEHTYGAVGAKKIQQTLVNKILGSAEDESAMYISKLLGKQEQLLDTSSENYSMQKGKVSESQGTSQQRHWQDVLTPQQIMGFAVGEFTGKVAESDTAFFHAQMKQVSAYDKYFTNKKLEDLPAGQKLVNIEENYKKIQRQAASIPQAIKRRQKEKEREELF